MNLSSIRDLLADQKVLQGLLPEDIDLMAGCGHNQVFEAGAFLAKADEAADKFFVVREGKVSVEVNAPTGPLLIETIGAGDLVGWSWLFPPHSWAFDVVALELTRVVVIEAKCLRDKCEADTQFGYRVIRRFTNVIVDRLQSTRMRLIDLYGSVDAR